MRISLKLLETDSQINTKILESIRTYLQPAFTKTQQSLQKNIPQIVKQALMAEPEYNSLLSGQLRAELGVPDAGARIESLFESWSNNMNVTSKPLSIKAARLSGGFSIDMIRSDFSDVVDLPAGIVTDNISGSVIPWLRWLLLDGSKILVRNYQVQMGSNPRSRTGQAIMITSDRENWRVPAEFAGTVNNNWITRAIERLDGTIINIIESELEKNI
jgi:hypothetical protein